MSATDPIYMLIKLPGEGEPPQKCEVLAKQCRNKALAEQYAATWLGLIEKRDGQPWKGDIAVCLFVSSVAPKRLPVVGDVEEKKE